MTDIDVKPEMIEKAAKALADDWNPGRDPVLAAMFRDYAQTALSAVLPDIIRKAQAEARDRATTPTPEPSESTPKPDAPRSAPSPKRWWGWV